jgi:hypothetical protein
MNDFSNPDRVLLDLSREDYLSLLFCIGAQAASDKPENFYRWVSLANRISEGNPDWTPYALPDGEVSLGVDVSSRGGNPRR